MWCLLAVYSAALMCACALADDQRNPIDLGRVRVHAHTGVISHKYKPNENDTIATRNARIALEHLRPYFQSGMGHIPPLEPYVRSEPLVIKISRSDFNCDLTLRDISVYGAQQFVLISSQIYTVTDRVDFDVAIPNVKVSVYYNVRLHSDAAETEFTAYANMTMQNVVASIAYTVDKNLIRTPPIGAVFQVVGMKLNVTADDVQYDLENLRKSRRAIPASKLTRLIFKEVKDEIALGVLEGMVEDLNRVLSYYTVEQIMDLILPTL